MTTMNTSSSAGIMFNATASPPRPDQSNCGALGYISYTDYTQINFVWWIFVVLYIIVIVVSVSGNMMVIWTVLRHKYMRTVTNYYILNLAICDFLISAFVMPLKLTEYAGTCMWQHVNVDALCSGLAYLLPVFVFASIFTLVAISIERYHAIVHPFESRKIHSQSRTMRILCCTWLAAILLPMPFVFYKSYPFSIISDYGMISRRICTDRFDEIDIWIYGANVSSTGSFRRGFLAFLFLTIYLLPALIIVCTCLRISAALLRPWNTNEHTGLDNRVTRRQEENKRKVARMIIIVALTFILSWTPFYVVNIVSQVQTISFLRRSNFLFTMLATHLCGFINSSINPIVYHAMSDRFRRSFMDIWCGIIHILCCGIPNRCGLSRFQNARGSHSSRSWSGGNTVNDTVVTTYCNSMTIADTKTADPKRSQRAAYSAMAINQGKPESCVSTL